MAHRTAWPTSWAYSGHDGSDPLRPRLRPRPRRRAGARASALPRPELDLLAVTTVAGNAGLVETTRNALRVLTLLGRTDIPVAAGAAGPLLRPLHVADNVHGATGLDGADLPEPGFAARPEGAIELLRAVLTAAPEPVTIAAVGPLTNIALLVRTHPELLDRVASIRVMGGAITEGNTTASAEFNIWQDPEAAQIVFECGRPITLMTLDTTHQALFTTADIERLEGVGTRVAAVFADLLRFFARFHQQRYGWDGSPIHDAVTVAHLGRAGSGADGGVSRRRRDDQRADPWPDGGGPVRADRSSAERRRGARDRPGAFHRPAHRGGPDRRGGRGGCALNGSSWRLPRRVGGCSAERRIGCALVLTGPGVGASPSRSGSPSGQVAASATSRSATPTRSAPRSRPPSGSRTSSSARSAPPSPPRPRGEPRGERLHVRRPHP